MADKSPIIRKEPIVAMGFFDALKEVFNGKHITKLDWEDPETYCLLKDDFLTICVKGKYHTWVVRKIDMAGNDWIVIDKNLN